MNKPYALGDETLELSIAGRVNGVTSRRRLAHFLYQQQESGTQHFRLDLSGVKDPDDLLMGFLIVFQERLEAHGGALRIIASTPELETAFEACGVMNLLGKRLSAQHSHDESKQPDYSVEGKPTHPQNMPTDEALVA